MLLRCPLRQILPIASATNKVLVRVTAAADEVCSGLGGSTRSSVVGNASVNCLMPCQRMPGGGVLDGVA